MPENSRNNPIQPRNSLDKPRKCPDTSVAYPGYSVVGSGYSVSSPPACSGVYRHHPGLKSVAELCLIRGSVTDMYKMTQSSRTTTDHPGYLVRGRPAPDPGKCDCGLTHALLADARTICHDRVFWLKSGKEVVVHDQNFLSTLQHIMCTHLLVCF